MDQLQKKTIKMLMKKIEYGGWQNCIKISNGNIELIATTDVGPRIISVGFCGGRNFFKTFHEQLGKTLGDDWQNYGGHRLWHAPEDKIRTYCPDNMPVDCKWSNDKLYLSQPCEIPTGVEKQIEIKMDQSCNSVEVVHRLINRNLWNIKASVWCLSVMEQGGRMIIPQEPYRAHPDYLLPARPLVLWHYTNMADSRWTWGEKFIQLKQDPKTLTKQKIGLMNFQGWGAYVFEDEIFIKTFPVQNGQYPDFGCNMEVFTNQSMLEFETLSTLQDIEPNACIEFTEKWHLFKAPIGMTEEEIQNDLVACLIERSAKTRHTALPSREGGM